MVMAQRWWKVMHGALGLIFVVIGIVAFVHPGNTFTALAAVFSFFLIFKGAFDIILSIATRQEIEFWWLQLVVGIAEIAIGFWAAGYFGHSVILLVAWVGASASCVRSPKSCSRSSCARPGSCYPQPERAALLGNRQHGRQKAASFTIDQVVEKLEAAITSGQQRNEGSGERSLSDARGGQHGRRAALRASRLDEPA